MRMGFKIVTVETDERSRVVLPGHRNSRFIMEELPGGAILLEPAVVMSTAQLEYLTTPALSQLLSTAAASKTVSGSRRQYKPE
ncbi:MAG TPA: hypothetical protein VMV52_04435 [Candidatus Nanopelagicaceae bacterium]|nr:hypothetical protein [Candidatus Nanopelagicaceae bacterium]